MKECVILLALPLLVTIATLRAQQTTGGPLAPTDLRCEYLVDPMGIDVASLRWARDYEPGWAPVV